MDLPRNYSNKYIIGGPCALESREQLIDAASELLPLNINIIRASLWKPRTQTGWDGLGTLGIPLLLEEAEERGFSPATEIMCAEHAIALAQYFKDFNHPVLVWMGARNQNHFEQSKIARILSETSDQFYLMFKNQIWEDETHWLGIYDHIIKAGFPHERILICHRGFNPGHDPNPFKFRNLPNFQMALRVKEKLGCPMIIDPSHIGGSPDNVLRTIIDAEEYPFDGYMIEVHPHVNFAKTDQKQQLDITQFKGIINRLFGSLTLNGAAKR